ncbi:phosphatidate phosphatase App1p [[Candida] railenensis]|uniref:Phosphatidate phosphatase App1p n=1 Tax=[Candida] railenensis TaxID=45579 RepID=A0A9P0W159_9ASCO|nr:phosphatidate phosphatase App1p [[Candida] railenensis]
MTEDTSRRAKLLGFARATRDTYIPKIAGTVAGSVTSLMGEQTTDQHTREGVRAAAVIPEDAYISLYPTYTRKIHNKDSIYSYHVDVNGWLSCPGLMTRKNRLILSLARQLTRGSSSAAASTSQKIDQEAAMVELKHQKQDIYDDSDSESIVSNSSSTNSAVASSGGDTLKERLAGFIARSIPNVELEITIESDNIDELSTHKITTDLNGNFNVCVECNYKPSTLKISAVKDESICAYSEVMLIEDVGVGIISDIDDTVKLTGVIGDKRELMRSLLLGDVSQWYIQTVVKWYEQIYNNKDFVNKVSFHYISNSPWQLFPLIQKYFHFADLPPGSVHLKQYTGNIIASLMEPASSKKKHSLYKVIGDFPGKKFVCVGDSGEYDIEAYTDAAFKFPSHILAIYIRVVPGSLSDRDESKILKQIRKILARKYAEEQSIQETIPIANSTSPISTTSSFSSTDNLIDLDSRPGPMVPKKPDSLKGKPVGRKPPLPDRNPASAVVQRSDTMSPPVPPLTPPRRENTSSSVSSSSPSPYDHPNLDLIVDALQEVYPHAETMYELEEIDKRGTLWITRVIQASEQLVGTNTEIRFFTDKDTDLVPHTAELIRKVLNS